ncbi:tetratricopeptide repeat protein [Lujinxingia litoralis]|nr:tetratricopeptide repeat protein [Lujinxingia litoralis]
MRDEFDLEEDGQTTPALMTLEALLGQGLDALPRDVRRALERDHYPEALKLANAHYAEKGAEDLNAALIYAILLVGRQLCEEALGVLRRALTHHAQNVSLQLSQVEALIVKGEFEAANALLDALGSVSTAEPRHRAFMGDMYLDMGAEDQAMDCYRQAVEQGVQAVDVSFRLGHLLFDREEFNEAAHYFGIAARLAGDNAMVWEMAATAYFEAGRVEDAAYAFKRVLQEDPENTSAWLYLGLCHQVLEDFEDAVDAFEEYVSLETESAVGWSQLGQSYLMLGRSEAALRAFEEAVNRAGDDVSMLNGATMAAYQSGDAEVAERWARRALEVGPENMEAQYNLGVLLLERRRVEEARLVLEQLVDQGPEDRGSALGALAVAEVIDGQRSAAFEHIAEAQRHKVDAEWLGAFAEEILKIEGGEPARVFLEGALSEDERWPAVRAMLSYVCAALAGESEIAGEQAAAFVDAVMASPGVVPMMWDFESWEAVAMRLKGASKQVFSKMLSVLEGRREIAAVADKIRG